MDVLTRPVDEITWGGTRWVESIVPSLGGNGANTSAALGKLGVPVRLLGAVGRDEFGDAALARLIECGVDISRVQRLAAGTATTVALVRSDGTRAFLHQPGVSRLFLQDPFELDDVEGFTHFHVGNPFAILHLRSKAPQLLSQARSLGLRTSLDTAWDALSEWMTVLGPCLPLVDILFTNEDEARMLTGSVEPAAVAQCLRDAGASTIVLKLGSRGCVVFEGTARYEMPAFAVTAIDTTGAGDCFAGGFLAALQRGLSLELAGRIANAAGALNVQALGATSGLLDWDATVAYTQSHDTA
jgi:sugar/nucleoside kinase (ribokinase family)